MKYNILLISIIFPFIFACEAIPDTREFPIIRTLKPIDINSSGATLRGEILTEGDTPITSYGFIWDTKDPTMNDSYKVLYAGNKEPSTFEIRIDSNLAGGIEYHVRSFVRYDSITVFGNNIRFISKGSLHNPWSLEKEFFISNDYKHAYGFSDNNYGYFMYHFKHCFTFDPNKKSIARNFDFPDSFTSVRQTNVVVVDDAFFLFKHPDNSLYIHKGGQWSVNPIIPDDFPDFSGYRHGCAISEDIYILSSENSFLYNSETGSWRKLEACQSSGFSIGGTDHKSIVYLLMSDGTIWKYNISENKWSILIQFPGDRSSRIVSFAHENKLYFGLSYKSGAMNRDFWSYNLISGVWDNLEMFPIEKEIEGLFFFDVRGKLYIGLGFEDDYSIWKFDPSKI